MRGPSAGRIGAGSIRGHRTVPRSPSSSWASCTGTWIGWRSIWGSDASTPGKSLNRGTRMGSRKIKRRRPKTVKMNPETLAIVQNQLQEFRVKFGREPGPKDPIFFNPDSLKPEPFRLDEFSEESEKAMVLAGIRPEIVYAHRKTGLIVSEESYGKLPKSAQAEWNAAVEEYFETIGRKAE